VLLWHKQNLKWERTNMCCGMVFTPPRRGQCGEQKLGFTIGERVLIIDHKHFGGWHGHVRCFDDDIIAVDLDEPPPGHQQNGQWFRPENLSKAPA